MPTTNDTLKNQGRLPVRHGDQNYTVTGGGETFDIDGFRGTTILEAKHVGKPGRSPFVPGSDAPDFIRQTILDSVDDEFRRIRLIIDDSSNPFDSVEVITNNEAARQLFGQMLSNRGLPQNTRIGE